MKYYHYVLEKKFIYTWINRILQTTIIFMVAKCILHLYIQYLLMQNNVKNILQFYNYFN